MVTISKCTQVITKFFNVLFRNLGLAEKKSIPSLLVNAKEVIEDKMSQSIEEEIFQPLSEETKNEFAFWRLIQNQVREDLNLFWAGKDFINHVKEKFGLTVDISTRLNKDGSISIIFDQDELSHIYHNQKPPNI